MAPTSPRLAAFLLAAAVVAGCSQDPAPRTGVADATATPPPPAVQTRPPTDQAPSPTAPSSTEAPGVPDPPDLSGNVIDCDAIDEPCDHGEDPELDRLWDACAEGDGRACDRLYYDSGFDTRYEQFGNTCGDRDMTIPCPEDLD